MPKCESRSHHRSGSLISHKRKMAATGFEPVAKGLLVPVPSNGLFVPLIEPLLILFEFRQTIYENWEKVNSFVVQVLCVGNPSFEFPFRGAESGLKMPIQFYIIVTGWLLLVLCDIRSS